MVARPAISAGNRGWGMNVSEESRPSFPAAGISAGGSGFGADLVPARDNPFLNDEDPGGWGFNSTAGRFITRGRGGTSGGAQPRARAGPRTRLPSVAPRMTGTSTKVTRSTKNPVAFRVNVYGLLEHAKLHHGPKGSPHHVGRLLFDRMLELPDTGSTKAGQNTENPVGGGQNKCPSSSTVSQAS